MLQTENAQKGGVCVIVLRYKKFRIVLSLPLVSIHVHTSHTCTKFCTFTLTVFLEYYMLKDRERNGGECNFISFRYIFNAKARDETHRGITSH